MKVPGSNKSTSRIYIPFVPPPPIELYTPCGPDVLHMPSCNGFLSFFLSTLIYITSGIDPDLSIDPDVSGIADLLAESYMCRWPDEWTKRVVALKEVRGEGWEAEVRMMNCIKMYGVSWTTLGVMVVRDHTSKGVPTMFWKHNLRKKKI